MPPHKTRLFVRSLKSIGFVDEGACEGADIILAKRREPAAKSKEGVMPDSVNTEEITKRLEDAEKRASEIAKRLEDAEKRALEAECAAKKARDEQQLAAIVAKIKSYKGLSVEADKFAPVLKSAQDALTAEQYAELERVLGAADAVAAQAMAPVGHSVDPGAATAIDQINKLASDLVTKGVVKTHAEGVAKAATDNPALYSQYQAERKRRA